MLFRSVNLGAEYAKQRVDVTPGSYIMLAVSDTGDGIDREHLARIFEPFFTTKELGKGTGLGLSTVYGIVTQSGGHISGYSEPGIGTTFRMYFPVARDPISQLQEEETIQYKGGSETILLVEDDFRIREYACTVLGELGYKVIEAEDGEDALRIIQETSERFDLMITDVIMPKMNGRELADRLKPVLPHLRVLYISGYTENAIVQRGILEPGLHYLAKPFSPPALAEKVRQIVDSPQVPKSILIIDDDPTLRELMELMLRVTDRDCRLINVPFGLAEFQAAFLQLLPVPPLTRDQVRMLERDNVVAPGALTFADLGIEPQAIEAILPTYLDMYRKGGRFSARAA